MRDASAANTALARPYRELYLLPTAPLDLVAEVYWHLVRTIREAAQQAPERAVEIEALNHAYRTIVGDGQPSSRWLHPEEREARDPRDDPWTSDGQPGALLGITQTAPEGVAKLAYQYWTERLHAEGEPDLDARLDQLDDAYRLVAERPSPEPERPSGEDHQGAATDDDERGREPPGPPPLIPLTTKRPMPSRLRLTLTSAGRQAAIGLKVAWQGLDRLSTRAATATQAAARRREQQPEAPLAEASAVPPAAASLLESRLAGLHGRGKESVPTKVLRGTPRSGPGTSTDTAPGRPRASIVPDGEQPHAIDADVYRIGTDPATDIAVAASGRCIDARVTTWQGQFLLQVLEGEANVLLNGEPVVSAMLSDGDRLLIGDKAYRFQIGAAHEGDSGVPSA